jgi:DNA-binding NarL/FixJ family response regulator
MQAQKVIIADDHPLFRSALLQVLTRFMPEAEVLTASSLASLQEVMDTHPDPALVLLDLRMPDCQGFSGLMHLRSSHPALPVVVISAAEDHDVVQRSVEFGAAGFIPKSASLPQIGEAIHAVMRGEIWLPEGAKSAPAPACNAKLSALTPQQLRVLQMLQEGLLNKQIAFELAISEATVKAHVSAILRKLDVNNRTQAVIAAGEMALDDSRSSTQII